MLRMAIISLCALGIALQAGCAGAPQVPTQFDLSRARIDAPAGASGPPGKMEGAVRGGVAGAAAVGLGTGVTAALPCILLGPFAPPCIAAALAVAAAGAAVGGVAGAAAGAGSADGPVIPDSPEQAAAKQEMFDAALAGLAVRKLLIDRLQRKTRESTGIELRVADPNAQDATATWRIAIEYVDIGPAQTDPDGRYALLAATKLTGRLTDSNRTAFHRLYQALSPEKRTTAEWGKENAAAVRSALDGLMLALADQMVSNLSGEDLTRDGVLWAHTHYHKEYFSRGTAATITKVDGIEKRDWQPIHLLPGQHLVEVQYLRGGFLCPVFGCEQERRIYELRVEARRSYLPFARRHCDKDWIGIVDTGRSAKVDLATGQAVGIIFFGDLTRDASTHVAVAGELPPLNCEGR